VLAKGVPAQASGQITAMHLPGIKQTASYARSYPQGSVAANIIGFTGTSHGVLTGGAGLELQQNALLAGRSGSEQVQIGTDGQQIPLAGSHNQPVVNGSSLRLTIVPALQYAAEQECASQVKKTKADNCTVVIIQPKTGAVLAMAQYPTYNPSDVTKVDQTTNLAVQAQFEPGSTAKVITASAALERGGQTPLSAYKIPYQIREGGQYIHDAEWAPERQPCCRAKASDRGTPRAHRGGSRRCRATHDRSPPAGCDRPRADRTGRSRRGDRARARRGAPRVPARRGPRQARG
jgi:cell division protein FtsI (penicillin-binding protein 3)